MVHQQSCSGCCPQYKYQNTYVKNFNRRGFQFFQLPLTNLFLGQPLKPFLLFFPPKSQIPIRVKGNQVEKMDGGDAPGQGTVTCATWIRRPENAHLVVVGKTRPSSLEIFSFDPVTTALSASPKVRLTFIDFCIVVLSGYNDDGSNFSRFIGINNTSAGYIYI